MKATFIFIPRYTLLTGRFIEENVILTNTYLKKLKKGKRKPKFEPFYIDFKDWYKG